MPQPDVCRRVPLGGGQTFRVTVLDGEAYLDVLGVTLAFNSPSLACLRLPVNRLRAVADALQALAGEVGAEP